MTISSTTPISSSSSSSSPQPQCLPLQQRRPINPPPYRLVFEPFETIPSTKKQDNNSSSSLHPNNFLCNDASQEYTRVPSRRTEPTSSTHETITANAIGTKGVIYMLHGWAQNVHVFSNRARKLTKRLTKAGYKVIFLQGPHRLPPVETTPTTDRSGATVSDEGSQHHEDANVNPPFSREYAYAWFLYNDICDGEKAGDERTTLDLRPSPTGDFEGLHASLAFLRNELEADRKNFCCETLNAIIPPTFLLGFSQGAVLVHKVATLSCESSNATNDGTDSAYTDASRPGGPFGDIEKCILVSGFSFTTSIRREEEVDTSNRCSGVDYRTAAGKKIMPSFHVLGTKDSRVSPQHTMELRSLEPCFGGRDNSQNILWEHSRGHVLPQDRKFCDKLFQFLAMPQAIP